MLLSKNLYVRKGSIDRGFYMDDVRVRVPEDDIISENPTSHLLEMISSMPAMYKEKSKGLKTEPCGTPWLSLKVLDKESLNLTLISRSFKKSKIQDRALSLMPKVLKSFMINLFLQTLSNGFEKSRKTATV
ncbi:hypothetical protein TNCV_2836151 [Trichonephila clavipes]|nr:hypothetical protein TNCV_2836151 [Trichonephila clavipes]